MAKFSEKIFSFWRNLNAVQRKHNSVKKYLLKNYGNIIAEFKNRSVLPLAKGDVAYPVWVCWWQGAEAMPPLVRACYNSLRKNADGHPVHLLTKNNYKQFVALPEYILEKTERGIITVTHLSDILRAELLYRYGGLWLDATVLVTSPLPDFAGQELFSLKRVKDNDYVAESRWSAYLFYLTKGHLLADFLRKMFAQYWQTENNLIAFFLIDYCIALAYEQIPAVRAALDACPYNNPEAHTLQRQLGTEYNMQEWQRLLLSGQFHKLTWKKEFAAEVNGRQTFYGWLLEKYT